MEKNVYKPDRFILNFNHHCNLKCEWCYVPFTGNVVNKDIIKSIINRCSDLGFKSVTFGGGDPFQYSFINQAARSAKKKNMFVHIDTNGISLLPTKENKHVLNEYTDLLGLPLDGPTMLIHDSMRSSKGHFNLINTRISWLKSVNIKLKINTIVSLQNYKHISLMTDVIKDIHPTRWSIYQYWPIGPSKEISQLHKLSNKIFTSTVTMTETNLKSNSIILEANQIDERRLTYPIIEHNGIVNLHSSLSNNFNTIGSIFDDNILEKITLLCNNERIKAQSRYYQSSI